MNRGVYMEFRTVVMEEQDKAYENFDGDTPDHMIVSGNMWNFLKENKRFETLADKSNPQRPGFLGMKVWPAPSLDKKGKVALLLSEDVFYKFAPTAKDFYNNSEY